MASTVDFRKIDRINQKHKNVVFGYIRRAQCMFASDVTYFNIHALIMHLCLLYYHEPLDSVLLNDEECGLFMQLLIASDKPLVLAQKQWVLLYRASKDGLSMQQCIDKSYGKPNVVCIIKGKRNNICGGFTSIGWTRNAANANRHSLVEDEKAFIFSLKVEGKWNGNIFNVLREKKNMALQHMGHQYCIFGNDWSLFMEADNHVYCNTTKVYQIMPSTHYFLLGGNHGDAIEDIEVFQVI